MKMQQAILEVMKELPSVSKLKAIRMGGGSYKALSYDDLIESIQPLFVKHGVTMTVSANSVSVTTQEIPKADGTVTLNFMVSGTWDVCFSTLESAIEVKSFGYALDTSDKADGKAVTYATKSAIMKCFAIQSSDDEEERPQASQSEPRTFAGRPMGSEPGPSEKQIAMIKKLGAEKGVSGTIPKTGKEASDLIAKLLKMPDVK